MRKVALLGLAVALCACTSRAQQTTYSWSWIGSQKAGTSTREMAFTAINVVTQLKLTSALLVNGCNSSFVYGYDPATLTGPLVVGEVIQSAVTFYKAASSISSITALGGPDPNGFPTYTVAAKGCTAVNFGGSQIGNGLGGASFTSTLFCPNGVCNSTENTVSFTLMHTDGSVSNETADAGSVVASFSENYYTKQITITGTFSGTLTSGQVYNGSFTNTYYSSTGSGRDPQPAVTAQSSSWAITTSSPVDTLVPGGTGGGGHPSSTVCGSKPSSHC